MRPREGISTWQKQIQMNPEINKVNASFRIKRKPPNVESRATAVSRRGLQPLLQRRLAPATGQALVRSCLFSQHQPMVRPMATITPPTIQYNILSILLDMTTNAKTVLMIKQTLKRQQLKKITISMMNSIILQGFMRLPSNHACSCCQA